MQIPMTGYQVRVDGESVVIGGTSAVAPLWAGLIALCNQRLGAALGDSACRALPDRRARIRDITQGNNGAYRAAVGLGRVHRARLAERHGAARGAHRAQGLNG